MNEDEKEYEQNENRYEVLQEILEEEEENKQQHYSMQMKKSSTRELKKHEKRISYNVNNVNLEDVNCLAKKHNEINDECVLEG